MALRRFFMFFALVLFPVTVLVGQSVKWVRTDVPMETLDSIYSTAGLVMRDTSEWGKAYYLSNKGVIRQYRDLYESDSSKVTITLTESGDEGVYIIQFLEMRNK